MTTIAPLVSVIVPVYNVENYLARCVNSIINQTYKNIEIICVNDFSLDNSSTILKDLQDKDSRIKVIHHRKNKGVGGARNTGIEAASGEFLCFIDSDDEISEDYIFELVTFLTNSKSDMVFCDVTFIDDDSSYVCNKKPFDNIEGSANVYDSQKKISRLVDAWPSPWNKIYRTEIIKNNKIYYTEKEIYEDHAFYYRYISACKKICYLPKTLYKYRINRPGQITTEVSSRIFDIFSVLEQLKPIFETSLNDNFEFRRAYSRICIRLLSARYRILKTHPFIRKEFVAKSHAFLSQFTLEEIQRNKDYYISINSEFIPKPLWWWLFHKDNQKYFCEYVLCGLKFTRIKHKRIAQELVSLNYYLRNITDF